MKRILDPASAAAGAATLLACLIFVVVSAASLAEGEVALTVDTVQAEAEGQAVVTITAENAVTLDSLQFRVNYDQQALRLAAEPVAGEPLADGIAVTNTDTAGVVGFAFACADGLAADGTVLTLTFDVLDETGSAVVLTDVLATTVDAALEQHKAYVTLENGGVAVGEDGQVPDPVVTPWPVETPTPTPTPTPIPTATPAPTATPTPTSPVLPGTDRPIDLPMLGIGALLLVTLVALLVALAVRNARAKKRRRKRKQQQMKATTNELEG